MGTSSPDLSTQLMETNDEYRRLAQQHSDYSKKLDEISARRFPSAAEQVEEARLKKMKLQLKDRMYQLRRQHEQQTS